MSDYIHITDSLSNNIDDIYINNDNDNKYACDNGFLFKELVDNILGSNNEVNFDNNCINIEMSISNESDYTIVDYKEDKIQIIENYYDKNNQSLQIAYNCEESINLSSEESNKCNNSIDLPSDVINISSGESNKCDSPINLSSDAININESNKCHNPIDLQIDVININESNLGGFFDCFNDDCSINNSIACTKLSNDKLSELATSYMFESEDLKKSYDTAYDDESYECEKIRKPKNVMGRVGVIVVSAMMLFSGSTINKLFI